MEKSRRKILEFLPAISRMFQRECFELNFKIHVGTTDHVLNFKIKKFRLKIQQGDQDDGGELNFTGKPSF